MMPHLSREDLEAYNRKDLPAARLLAASRHVAECRDCAGRLLAHTGNPALPSLAADDDEGHLNYEQIEAYVDRRLPVRERAAIDAHLAACTHCAGDLAGVRTLAERMAVRPVAGWRERIWTWFRVPQLAMAAAALAVTLVLTASFLLIRHNSSPAEVAAIPPELLPPSTVDLPPTHRDAVIAVLRGESHTSTAPDDDAIDQARRKDPNAHLLLGALYQQRNMWVEAEREYKLLLDANPHSKEARRLWENARKHVQGVIP